MELYTLLSLCIGIFGGTYAALNACRTHFEYLLKDECERGLETFKAMEDLRIGGESMNICKKRHARLKRWRSLWNCAHTIPAVVFFIVMATLAGWAIWHWDEVMAIHDQETLKKLHGQSPWCHFHQVFSFMCLVDLIAVLVAAIAYFICKNAATHLSEAHTFVQSPKLADPNASQVG